MVLRRWITLAIFITFLLPFPFSIILPLVAAMFFSTISLTTYFSIMCMLPACCCLQSRLLLAPKSELHILQLIHLGSAFRYLITNWVIDGLNLAISNRQLKLICTILFSSAMDKPPFVLFQAYYMGDGWIWLLGAWELIIMGCTIVLFCAIGGGYVVCLC